MIPIEQKNNRSFSLPLSFAGCARLMMVVMMLLTGTAFAQNYQSEVEIMQETFGLEKKVVVSNFIQLGEEAESFWIIYDEYEAKRKQLGMDRIKVITDYANSYSTITDEQILELYKRTTAFQKSFAKLQQTYFKQMSKAVGPRVAAQFWQLESYFNAMIQAEIYTQIPFIGENLQED